ncbi:hypothetical protein AB6D81_20675 [Vibrio splendidus]|uniref:hypothetical protein n=1 Tax=Vibrio splendidus TaxID=29497 RepID=UPI0011B292F2|nr:hypothetical protein [Vibrio splendidus]
MSEKASVRFYRVNKCGLAKRHARQCSIGSYKSVIENIYNWAKGKYIQNTCTYEISEDSEMEFLQTYLVSAQRNSKENEYLFTFWNRTHESGDSVYALDSTVKMGDLSSKSFHKGNLPESSIPGYATYFWFLPNKGVFATITFGNPRNGLAPMSYWLENFLVTESRYAKFEGLVFKGFEAMDGTLHQDLEPCFRKELFDIPAKKSLIMQYSSHIKGVIRRVHLSRGIEVDETTFLGLSKILGMKKAELEESDMSLSYELSYVPTQEELKDIIEQYETTATRGKWEDVGFKFSESNDIGMNKKEWLSKSYAKAKISLEVEWVIVGQLLNTPHLLKTINSHKQELFNHIKSVQQEANKQKIANDSAQTQRNEETV